MDMPITPSFPIYPFLCVQRTNTKGWIVTVGVPVRVALYRGRKSKPSKWPLWLWLVSDHNRRQRTFGHAFSMTEYECKCFKYEATQHNLVLLFSATMSKMVGTHASRCQHAFHFPHSTILFDSCGCSLLYSCHAISDACAFCTRVCLWPTCISARIF